MERRGQGFLEEKPCGVGSCRIFLTSVESLRMSLTEADTSKKTNLDAFIPDIWRHRQLVMAA